MHTQLITRLIFRQPGQLLRGIKTCQAAVMAPIKVGDAIPSVDLFEGNPGNKVNTKDFFAKGKHVMFAIPGAFTPTCQNDHFPTFVKEVADIKAKGVASVSCVSVNDPFVMEAFGKALGAEGKIRCFADTCGELTKALDLELDTTAILGNKRSQRYAMVVTDGKVTGLNVEPDSSKATCTKASGVLDLL